MRIVRKTPEIRHTGSGAIYKKEQVLGAEFYILILHSGYYSMASLTTGRSDGGNHHESREAASKFTWLAPDLAEFLEIYEVSR